jgi:hypothetical protein
MKAAIQDKAEARQDKDNTARYESCLRTRQDQDQFQLWHETRQDDKSLLDLFICLVSCYVVVCCAVLSCCRVVVVLFAFVLFCFLVWFVVFPCFLWSCFSYFRSYMNGICTFQSIWWTIQWTASWTMKVSWSSPVLSSPLLSSLLLLFSFLFFSCLFGFGSAYTARVSASSWHKS